MIAHTSNELYLGKADGGEEVEEGKGGENEAEVKASQLPASTATATKEEPNQKSEHVNVGSRLA